MRAHRGGEGGVVRQNLASTQFYKQIGAHIYAVRAVPDLSIPLSPIFLFYRPVKIVLREGTYRADQTISFVTGAHNNLTITSYEGEDAQITGDKAITTNWKQVGSTPDGSLPIWVADLSGQGDLGDFVGLRFKGGRVTRARYPNSNPELEQANSTYVAVVFLLCTVIPPQRREGTFETSGFENSKDYIIHDSQTSILRTHPYHNALAQTYTYASPF